MRRIEKRPMWRAVRREDAMAWARVAAGADLESQSVMAVDVGGKEIAL
jgi:hypothetical protein